jgi:hypothetical protein
MIYGMNSQKNFYDSDQLLPKNNKFNEGDIALYSVSILMIISALKYYALYPLNFNFDSLMGGCFLNVVLIFLISYAVTYMMFYYLQESRKNHCIYDKKGTVVRIDNALKDPYEEDNLNKKYSGKTAKQVLDDIPLEKKVILMVFNAICFFLFRFIGCGIVYFVRQILIEKNSMIDLGSLLAYTFCG